MKCKHGLGEGTCYTCKTGKKIKEEGVGADNVLMGKRKGIELTHGWMRGKRYESKWGWLVRGGVSNIASDMGLKGEYKEEER